MVLFLVAALVTVAVYPEIFITFKTSFVMWGEALAIEYPLTFILTSFFYQGGIQLWDFFGQMPFFHTYAVFGLFKFPNLITAITYYILAPFSDDSGRLFHHVFAWANLMTLLFIRIVGIFLLLKIVTRNRIILTLGTVIFAVFYSTWAFNKGAYFMSYFPLGIYFIVRFFEGLQGRYLAAIFLFICICLGTGIHYCGFMYLPLHFLIISGILWRIFFNPPARNSIMNRKVRWKDVAWVILVAVLILAPYAYIFKFGFPDLAFDQAHSRISHLYSPQWYFHKLDLDLGDPRHFFTDFLNFQDKSVSLYYLGWTLPFLALAGLILSRNNIKWLFGLGIIFLWLLSFPREGMNIGLLAHWINALTNPLKTIVRSYHYACQSMLPYLLMPLAVMGIEALKELYLGKKYSGLALGALGAMTLAPLLTGIAVLPDEARRYLIVCIVLIVSGIAWIHLRNSPRARVFLITTICFFAVIDIILIVQQAKAQVATYERRPSIFDISPQSGMVGYDFENPLLFIYPYSYTLQFSYGDEVYLWFPHSITSDLRHVINQGLNYTWLNGYNPRHVEFAKWLSDPSMLTYLQQNNEFIFLASAAIKASPDALSRITGAGLAKQVVEVEDPAGELKLPGQWPAGISNKEEDFQYNQITGTFDQIPLIYNYRLRDGMIISSLQLPAAFPDYLATSLFPPEQHYLRFFIEGEGNQWKEFQHAQGELIRPYTFDVQNIQKGVLTSAFPENDYQRHRKYVLFYPSSENQGVEGLWRRQFDNLGITYRAKKDGWLVGHYPYDSKWRISVDGKEVPYYRVNETFIGFPLARGEHKIFIQYWPHSPLRFLLLISAFLTTLGLPILIYLSLRWEQNRKQE